MYSVHQKILLLIIAVFANTVTVYTQTRQGDFPRGTPTNTTRSSGPGQAQFGAQKTKNIPTKLESFYLENRDQKIAFADSTLNQFQNYNPTDHPVLFSQFLGNVGSAARPLLFTIDEFRKGIQFGFNQYDNYKLNRRDFAYDISNMPVGRFHFSPGTSQKDFVFKAKFSESFADNIRLSVDYQRIIHQGDYMNQSTRQTHLGFGFQKSNPKHDLFLTTIINANNEENNGGINSNGFTELERGQFSRLIDVTLTDGLTRHANSEISLSNFFHITKDDSDVGFTFEHELAWDRGSFKYSDETQDSTFYGPFLTDDRGIRMFIKYAQYSTLGRVHLTLGKFALRGGLEYSHHRIDQEPDSYSVNDLNLLGQTSFQINQKLDVLADAYFGLASNAGEYRLKGKVNFSFLKNIKLQGGVLLSRYNPSIIERNLYISNNEVYNNDFTAPLYNSISLRASLPWSNIFVEGKQTIITNPIYINSNRLPDQYDGTISISQVTAQFNPKVWIFNFENQIGFQFLTEDLYELPQFISEHHVYMEGNIFKKKMSARLGASIQTVQAYTAANYTPILGKFYLQKEGEERRTPLYSVADAYASFKVDAFRFFFKIENFNQMFLPQHDFLVNNYPVFDWRFRFGFGWILKN